MRDQNKQKVQTQEKRESKVKQTNEKRQHSQGFRRYFIQETRKEHVNGRADRESGGNISPRKQNKEPKN